MAITANYEKARRVFESCVTVEQYQSAAEFCQLARENDLSEPELTATQSLDISVMYSHLISKICAAKVKMEFSQQ